MVNQIDLRVEDKNNLLQKIRISALGLGMVLAILSVGSAPAPAGAADLPFPAPTLLVPVEGKRLGQDKAWVGGVAKNGSVVKVFVDGKESGQIKVRSHRSGTASFGLKLSNLAIGEHLVTATAQDNKGKTSAESNSLAIMVSQSTPAPTLARPRVNADSGIDRPFIIGNIQNGLMVGIIIDGKIQATLTPEPSASGVTSFAWQPATRLALGRHFIEAFASDQGKLSNHDQIFWQVGEVKSETSQEQKPETPPVSVAPEPAEPTVTVTEREDSAQKLTVREDLESKEQPVIPDAEPIIDDSQGKIESTATEPETKVSQVTEPESQSPEVTEVSPGAVVRSSGEEEASGFKLNNSLIVGITILVFLLLSMVVWYIQERRDKLGEKVVSMFREGDGDEASEIKSDQTDLPPPPPPMF